MVPQRDASSGTGKSSFVPQYKVQPPTDVYTTGSGSTCTVHWTKQGHAQSYSVTADGIDSGTATNRNSLDFRMSPWAKCNTASVQQVFNGATSDAATGGPYNGAPYTYEKKAVINKPQELRWSDNAHVINVTGGSVDVYGKSATVQIIINGQPFTWNSGQPLDVTDLAVAADGNYAWSVKVTGGPGYSGLDNTADGGSVAGTRPSDSSEGTKSLKSGTDVTTWPRTPGFLVSAIPQYRQPPFTSSRRTSMSENIDDATQLSDTTRLSDSTQLPTARTCPTPRTWHPHHTPARPQAPSRRRSPLRCLTCRSGRHKRRQKSRLLLLMPPPFLRAMTAPCSSRARDRRQPSRSRSPRNHSHNPSRSVSRASRASSRIGTARQPSIPDYCPSPRLRSGIPAVLQCAGRKCLQGGYRQDHPYQAMRHRTDGRWPYSA